MIKPIHQYPAEVLTAKCVPVVPVGNSLTGAVKDAPLWGETINQFITDLTETAESIRYRCLGLAANQIWDQKEATPALFVMRWPIQNYKQWEWRTIINPIIKSSGKKINQKEGCLSLQQPKILETIKSRRANVELQFQTPESSEIQTIKFYGTLGPYARIVHHEYDHLQGTLCNER
ncbi:MAG: peptide deformylase [Rhodobacteraceae bacterium]|nr:peptide deformylase [Paracoccaceae bacterium]